MSSHQTLSEIEATIQALQAQRALLGDRVVDTALAPLRAQQRDLLQMQAQEKLRQVSMLFVDIVGSTALGVQIDAEDLHAVIDRVLGRCAALVSSHGGEVMQFAGDGFLAAFGVRTAREDDTERAVLCGLAMLQAGRQLAVEVLQRHAYADFGVRVGVHTGGVLLAGGVDSEYSLRGSAVSLAARMQQTAPPGSLRISQAAGHQVRGRFDLVSQPPLVVRGLEAPIATYLVARVRPRRFTPDMPGVDGVATPLVGRTQELATLRGAVQQVAASGQLASAMLVGEAGVGKSRLLYEFSRWFGTLRRPCVVLRGRAMPQTAEQPFGMLRDMLAWRLHIGDGRSMVQARRIFVRCVAPLFRGEGALPEAAEMHAHMLGHLIGLDFSDSPHLQGIADDTGQVRQRAFHAAALALRRMAAKDRFILLLLDDLHWADAGSLDLLRHVREACRDVPLLAIALCRPALFEPHPDLAETGSGLRIDLTPLPAAASGNLADALLKRLPEVPTMLRTLLVERSAGNPFYMEELVRMWLDQEALRPVGQRPSGQRPAVSGPQSSRSELGGLREMGQFGSGPALAQERWRLDTSRLHADAVPTTLTGLLQARLDALAPQQRRALQQAAVLGPLFWDQGLAALDEAALAALPVLAQRALLQPRPEADNGSARAWAFVHPLLQEVVYATVLKRERRSLHALAAAWLAAQAGPERLEWLAAAAAHWAQADEAVRAVRLYARAAEQARRRHAHEAALQYVGRALELLRGATPAPPDSTALQWQLRDVRERILDLQGQREAQRADMQALAQLAELLDDDGRRAELALRSSLVAGRSGDYPAQEMAARQALALAQRCGDRLRRLNAQRLLADARLRQGDAEAGAALAQEGLAEARAHGLHDAESRYLNTLMVLAARRQDMVGVLHLSREAAAARRAMGDARNEALALASLGTGWLELGALAPAQDALNRALELQRLIGDRANQPITQVNLSQLALWRGDVQQAQAMADAAVRQAREASATDMLALALWAQGHAALAGNQAAPARHAFAEAAQVAADSHSDLHWDALAGLARCALAAEDLDAALAQAQPLLAHQQAGGTLDGCAGPRLVSLVCHQVLVRTASSQADALLRAAHDDLMAEAEMIGDLDLRQSFLRCVPENHALMESYSRLAASA